VRDAVRGVRTVYARERNFRIQTVAATAAIIAAAAVGFGRGSWIVLLLLICAVLVLEIVNSAVEQMLDVLKPRLHDQVKIIKDMMAAAVLAASVAAAVVGVLLFAPFLVELRLGL
jgi:diacylglycerol kinase